MAKKTTAKSTSTKKTARKAAKRELIDTGTDKRFVRRGMAGRFKESDDVGKSLTADRRKEGNQVHGKAWSGRSGRPLVLRLVARIKELVARVDRQRVAANGGNRSADDPRALGQLIRRCMAKTKRICVLSSRPMAVRKCMVSYRDGSGVRHGVSVRAEGVREACCLALAEFKARRKDGDWGEPPGDATELTVEVLPPPTTHVMKVAEVRRWLETAATDPAQSVAKSRLKRLLG